MKKNKIIAILINFVFFINIASCNTVKEGLVGTKRSEQSDEFLVEKKNPLEIPPDFYELPLPGEKQNQTNIFSDNKDVKELLNIDENENGKETNQNSTLDIETSVLKKIQ